MGSEIFKIKAVMAEKFEYKNDNSILWLMILGYHIFISLSIITYLMTGFKIFLQIQFKS